MIRTISIACVSAIGLAAVVACASMAPPPPDPGAVCEALRPDMPVKFHGGPDGKGGPGFDTRDTVARMRKANARFEAACPPAVR